MSAPARGESSRAAARLADSRRGGSTPEPRSRRGYLDGMRGLAVLIMIEAHLLDTWTAAPHRQSPEFTWSDHRWRIWRATVSVSRGVAVALAAGSRVRRGGDARAAARTVGRRGLEIFALPFLFRLQAVILSWGAWRTLLKVDIAPSRK